jgi:hypothetical protein
MAIKTAKKRKLETRRTITVIVAAGIFLLVVLLLNTLTTWRGLRTHDCLLNMVFIEKAMQKMQKEFAFKFSIEKVGSDYILRCLPIYMQYGKNAFFLDDQGFVKVKGREEVAALAPITAGEDYLMRVPHCPSGARYRLVPSVSKPGLFDVECPKHGLLEQPDKEGRYTFSGDIHELPLRDSAIGVEAVLYFPRTVRIDERSVTIAPKIQPQKIKVTAPPTPAAPP